VAYDDESCFTNQHPNDVGLELCGGRAQAWIVGKTRITNMSTGKVLTWDPATNRVSVATNVPDSFNQYFDVCDKVPAARNFVRLVTKNKQVVYALDSLLLLDAAADLIKEVWVLDEAAQSLQVMSKNECLDASPLAIGFDVRTKPCDKTSASQKWLVREHKVQHASHVGICLAVEAGSSGIASVKAMSCKDVTTNRGHGKLIFHCSDRVGLYKFRGMEVVHVYAFFRCKLK